MSFIQIRCSCAILFVQQTQKKRRMSHRAFEEGALEGVSDPIAVRIYRNFPLRHLQQNIDGAHIRSPHFNVSLTFDNSAGSEFEQIHCAFLHFLLYLQRNRL